MKKKVEQDTDDGVIAMLFMLFGCIGVGVSVAVQHPVLKPVLSGITALIFMFGLGFAFDAMLVWQTARIKELLKKP